MFYYNLELAKALREFVEEYKRREATYEIIKAIDNETLTKAMQNVDEDWLKKRDRLKNKR